MRVTKTTSVADLLLAAQTALQDVEPGETFTVRDLFRGFEWNRVPKGLRIQLGNVFNAYAKGEGADLVDIGDKTAQNQQRYVRK